MPQGSLEKIQLHRLLAYLALEYGDARRLGRHGRPAGPPPPRPLRGSRPPGRPARRHQGLRPATVVPRSPVGQELRPQLELGVLTRMLRLAYEHNKLVRLPVVRKLREAPPRSGFFERTQFEAVRAKLPDDLKCVVTLLHTYGWRTQSEVLALERRQLDLAAGTLRLDPGQTKNDDARVVYLTPELTAMLTAHVTRIVRLERKLGRIIPYLFPHLTGRDPALPGGRKHTVLGARRLDFRRACRTACRAAGVPGMLRHDFRRTAVRNLVASRVSERVAMTITGHKTRSVFDRYHIVSPRDLQEASRRLAITSAITPPPKENPAR